MTERTDDPQIAIDRLRNFYSGGEYPQVAGGFDGVGGMEENFVAALSDVALAAQVVGVASAASAAAAVSAGMARDAVATMLVDVNQANDLAVTAMAGMAATAEGARDQAVAAAASVAPGEPDGTATLGPDGKLAAAQRPVVEIAGVTGLAAALDDKAAASLSNVTNADFAAKALAAGVGGGGGGGGVIAGTATEGAIVRVVSGIPTWVLPCDTTTVCIGGWPIYSTQQAGYEASKAFDGSYADNWFSIGGPNDYIGYQFSSPKIIRRIAVSYSSYGGGQASFWSTSWTVQVSANGAAWSDLVTITPAATASRQVFDVPTNAGGAYWRILNLTNMTNCVAELEMYGLIF